MLVHYALLCHVTLALPPPRPAPPRASRGAAHTAGAVCQAVAPRSGRGPGCPAHQCDPERARARPRRPHHPSPRPHKRYLRRASIPRLQHTSMKTSTRNRRLILFGSWLQQGVAQALTETPSFSPMKRNGFDGQVLRLHHAGSFEAGPATKGRGSTAVGRSNLGGLLLAAWSTVRLGWLTA
eukprot:SAG31_NODE_6469_length_2005_cov_2.897167_2_plen_181_part_00